MVLTCGLPGAKHTVDPYRFFTSQDSNLVGRRFVWVSLGFIFVFSNLVFPALVNGSLQPLSPKTHFVGLSAVSQTLTCVGFPLDFIWGLI